MLRHPLLLRQPGPLHGPAKCSSIHRLRGLIEGHCQVSRSCDITAAPVRLAEQFLSKVGKATDRGRVAAKSKESQKRVEKEECIRGSCHLLKLYKQRLSLFVRGGRAAPTYAVRVRAPFQTSSLIIRAAIAQPHLLSADADVCQQSKVGGHVAGGRSDLLGTARRQGGRCQSCRAWRSVWPALLPAWHLQPSSQMPS